MFALISRVSSRPVLSHIPRPYHVHMFFSVDVPSLASHRAVCLSPRALVHLFRWIMPQRGDDLLLFRVFHRNAFGLLLVCCTYAYPVPWVNFFFVIL